MTEQAQIAAVTQHLTLFVPPGQVAELRALNFGGAGRTASGYFDAEHLEAMAAHALALETDCSGVYFTLNPVLPRLLARRPNDVDRARSNELTKDEDVSRLRWLLVDADPVRPAGVSATEAEK